MKTNENLSPKGSATYPDGAGGKSPLKMHEYGRLVQKMAQHALQIEERPRRQAYAERIVRVMAHLNPKLKNEKDYRHKLWDHLAYITDYQLDVDYPFVIHRQDASVKPRKLPYPRTTIRYRHYGHLLEEAIRTVGSMPNGATRQKLGQQVAMRMKRNLSQWKGGGATDTKVQHDLELYAEERQNKQQQH